MQTTEMRNEHCKKVNNYDPDFSEMHLNLYLIDRKCTALAVTVVLGGAGVIVLAPVIVLLVTLGAASSACAAIAAKVVLERLN
jgi:hypothetical protein